MNPRKQFVVRLFEEIDFGRLMDAAAILMPSEMVWHGEIGPDYGINQGAKIGRWISWLDLRQLKELREVAASLIVTRAVH
jgi:hypothetical protein